MRIIIFGAAGLLLSGTALAGVVANKGMDRPIAAVPVAAKAGDGLGAAMIGNAITIDWPAKRADARARDRKEIIAAAKAPPEVPVAEMPSAAAMSDAGADKGMGGPEEPVETAAGPATAPASYPACRPGPGDDRCIQLYEPGVRESLARREAGGDGQQIAMGGPEEPLDVAATDGQGDEAAAYEPLPEDAVMPASGKPAKTELAGESAELPTAI